MTHAQARLANDFSGKAIDIGSELWLIGLPDICYSGRIDKGDQESILQWELSCKSSANVGFKQISRGWQLQPHENQYLWPNP